ncbi:hypothetical protein K3495_g2857 [Podosphaera aphanis]|nr:hypothetical protein K3495_g2857 [Podosphaera aphanis]
MHGENCVVSLPSGPTKFGPTSSKPHYANERIESESNTNDTNDNNNTNNDGNDGNGDSNGDGDGDNPNTIASNDDHTKDKNTLVPNIRRYPKRNAYLPIRYRQGRMVVWYTVRAVLPSRVWAAWTHAPLEIGESWFELRLDKNQNLLILEPLYGISEAGKHWYHTYHKHFEEKLHMEESTYDFCLLISKPTRKTNNGFCIVGIQTNDTLILADETFASQEEVQRQKANIKAKPVEHLSSTDPIDLNGSHISVEKDGIISLTQQKHCKEIKLINHNDYIKTQYISQRALGAYIATFYQPEASFDLSQAAQTVNPNINSAAMLKRLKWQKSNSSGGLGFIALDPKTIKILVFTDGSFANNKEDMTSQIGYVICLADNTNKANILHWSSTKCKRISCSVLTSELYAMVTGFDMVTVIKGTIKKVSKSLRYSSFPSHIPLILCTDSRSLYECLSKLGTTTEKRLMVDIMALRRSYEHNEVTEIGWIEGSKNPVDAMTKYKPCDTLRKLIDKNEVDISANS